MLALRLALVSLVAVSCSGDGAPARPDAGGVDGAGPDSLGADAGAPDAAAPDAAAPDAPALDAPALDAPELDAPALDAPELDAAAPDAAAPDAAALDAAAPDAANPDASVDAGPWIDPLDHAFGADGFVTFDGAVVGLAVLPDQKILIAGVRTPVPPASYGTGFLERRLRDGSLDPSFDGDGVVDLAGGAGDMAVLADGRILVTGPALRLFSADGALITTLATASAGGGFERIIALPDGGFAVVVVSPLFLATRLDVYRYDAFMQRLWASPQGLLNFNAGVATLAHVTADGGDHVVLSTEGQLVSRATATGAADGAFAGLAWLPADYAVTVHDGLGRVAAVDAPPGAMRIRWVASSGATGPAVGATGCLAAGTYARPAVAVDATGRLLLAPWVGATDRQVSVVRIAPGLDQLDPAWGCGRWFQVPPYCPPAQPCLGAEPSDATVAVGLEVASDGTIVVAGHLARSGGPYRGYLARLMP
ncbi:MAG: hypothetical protein R3B06_09925 [Kofleriaceae bacterium]